MGYSDGINKEHRCSAHCGRELQGPAEAWWGTLESRFQCAVCVLCSLPYNVCVDFKALKLQDQSCCIFPKGKTRNWQLSLCVTKLSNQDQADPCHIATCWYQLLSLFILTKQSIHLNLSFSGTNHKSNRECRKRWSCHLETVHI